MNPVITTILKFLGQRTFHFTIYAIIGIFVWGIYHKLFLLPTNNNTTTVRNGGKLFNVYENDEDKYKFPMFGCAAWRIHNETYWKKTPRDTKERIIDVD